MRQNVSYLELLWRGDPVAELRARGLASSVDVLLTPQGPDGIVRFGGLAGARVQTFVARPFLFTPPMLRTLFSAPVLIIPAPNPQTFVAPGAGLFVGKQGTLTYSAPPRPDIEYVGTPIGSSVDLDPSSTWDGSAPTVGFSSDMFVSVVGGNIQDIALALGVGLEVASGSGADVTGGDASAMLILTYALIDCTGLL